MCTKKRKTYTNVYKTIWSKARAHGTTHTNGFFTRKEEYYARTRVWKSTVKIKRNKLTWLRLGVLVEGKKSFLSCVCVVYVYASIKSTCILSFVPPHVFLTENPPYGAAWSPSCNHGCSNAVAASGDLSPGSKASNCWQRSRAWGKSGQGAHEKSMFVSFNRV